jgi:choline dehydrogenase
LHVLVESVKKVRRFLTASPWKGYVVKPYGMGETLDITSDAAIEKFVKTYTASQWHPVGTSSMSSKTSTTGVTNPDLTVKKVAGIRVVDASVFPYVPASHIQASVYIMAERAADIIKAAYP